MAQTLVDNRYRLLHRLGDGGTWLARDELLGRRVAIRESPSHEMSTLDHPGIIHTYDLVHWEGRSYVVVEHIPAGSLRDGVPLSHPKAARIGLACIDALRAAEAAGLRHGRLTPGNILLTDDGRPVLTDFRGSGTPDLPALGAVLRWAVRNSPGPVLTAAAALEAGVSAAQAEVMLRMAAEGVEGAGVARPVGRVRSAGPARSTRVAVAVAVALLVGTSGTALILDKIEFGGGLSAASPTPSGWAPSDHPGTTLSPARPQPQSTLAICDDQATAGATVKSDPAERPYALPPGWLWHRDPAGFDVAVPAGWTRASDGTTSCFRDPDGDRSFEVRADTTATTPAVARWESAERSARDTLPGYARVALRPVGTGADWEFTWAPGDGPRRHERRLLLSTGADRTYVVSWSTRAPDWPGSEALQSLVVASLS